MRATESGPARAAADAEEAAEADRILAAAGITPASARGVDVYQMLEEARAEEAAGDGAFDWAVATAELEEVAQTGIRCLQKDALPTVRALGIGTLEGAAEVVAGLTPGSPQRHPELEHRARTLADAAQLASAAAVGGRDGYAVRLLETGLQEGPAASKIFPAGGSAASSAGDQAFVAQLNRRFGESQPKTSTPTPGVRRASASMPTPSIAAARDEANRTGRSVTIDFPDGRRWAVEPDRPR